MNLFTSKLVPDFLKLTIKEKVYFSKMRYNQSETLITQYSHIFLVQK